MNKNTIRILKGYTLYGFLTGLGITLSFYILFHFYSDMTFVEMKELVPLMYIVDGFPLIFGFAYHTVGFNVQRRKDALYGRLKKQIEIVERTSLFAEDIGKGELESEFDSLGEDNDLGKALLKMRDSLKRQAREEEEQNWIIEGVSEIGSILRNNNKVVDLGYELLQYLVPKMDAVQGAFYTAKEDEDAAELRPKGDIKLVSTYAYGRRKYQDKEFRFGQGLVGQAAAERDIVYRKEIPEHYVSITSGLIKDRKPSTILIIPLIADNQMYGLIEFASLNDFTERQLKFLREVSTIIARTLFNIATNEKTLDLLEKVNRSQERTQVLLANASEVITIYDEEAKIKYVSPSVKNILGFEAEELIGSKEESRIKVGLEVIQSMFQKLLDNPTEPVMGQYSYIKKNGEEVWLETSGQNLMNNEAIQGILFNTRDITERRQAEKEQRERSKMQALSENSPDIIIRFDMASNFSYVNPAIETYTGINALDFLNKNLFEVDLNDSIRKDFSAFKDKVNETKSKIAEEMRFPSITGENLYMEVNGIPEFNEDKELESVLMVVHDITEAKEAEEKVKEANMKVMDSINYAKRIQGSMLPKAQVIKNHFDNSFMYFKPRDLVSGDFPFFYEKGDWVYVSAVDCTGHGVPGALLSIIGTMILSETLTHNNPSASELNDFLHEGVVSTLRQGQEGGENERDGMDIAMCKINIKTGEMEYSGAHRPLYIIRKDHPEGEDLEQFKGDKYPIGGVQYKGREKFINYTTQLNKGDRIYFFSDGYPDQFDITGMKKIGPKRIRKMLVNMKDEKMDVIENELDQFFRGWQGDSQQMDDVLFIGIEF